MNNNHPVAVATKLIQVVDWNNVGDIQKLLEACNSGKVGPALTRWLAQKGWENHGWVSDEISKIKQSPEIPITPVAIPSNLLFLDLTKTGPTFGDWLTAREKLHLFLTGETVNLREMFIIADEILSHTDIMPVFRPVGATNRMALDWKVKLGMNASYEEVDVMKYTGANGSQVPELYYINRSVIPDENTLGDNAKSPNDLIRIPNTIWIDLYGWSDADNLYYLITGNHLDSGGTWTWFPNDRLPGGRRVACGDWCVDDSQAKFGWGNRRSRYSYVGARVARALSLKTS